MAHQTNETLRKFLHIAIGFGAIALKFVPWRWAALICAVAAVSNWLLLHRLVGKAVARHERALLGRSGPGRSRRRGNSLLGSRADGVSTRIGARKNVLFLRFYRRPAAGTLLNREGD